MRGLVSAVLVFGMAGAAAAQAPQAAGQAQKQSRYQIGQMERMLEGAAEHAAKNTRDRLEAVMPASMMMAENARARGFRLEGYGVFFDVVAPSMDFTLPWSLRTLDQNDLGLDSALKALRAHVDSSGDRDLEQAFKRVELQVSIPPPPAVRSRTVTNARDAVGSAAATPKDSVDTEIVNNPLDAYRAEVRQALTDAMLDYSGPLAIGPEEWLTVGVRRNDDRPQLGPADSDAVTMIIRVKGADLTAFRAGRESREEVLKHVEVRVF